MRTYTHQRQHHPARGARGREERWGALLLVALVVVSTAGTRALGTDRMPPNDSVCSLTQLTTTGINPLLGSATSNINPSINALGTRIAFISTADLTGDNSDGNEELFLVDTTTGTFTQLTTTTTSGFTNINPSINALGTRIAFASRADLTGDNPDGNYEIFLADTTMGSLTQLTHGGGFSSLSPSINALGTRIAFESFADLTGDNPDGSMELFLVDTLTNHFTQLTTTTGFDTRNLLPSINALGTRIAFLSNANLTGDNPDGNLELFLADTMTGSLTQLTITTSADVGTFYHSINALGTRIAFVSNADLTGGNPDGNQELFVVNTLTNRFTQLTTTGHDIFYTSINALGTRIAFSSGADLTGGNPDGLFQAFLVNTLTNRFTQLTIAGDAGVPTINPLGTHVAFLSRTDHTGDNPDGNLELFLATCVGTVHDHGTMTSEETGEQEQ
jgi:Tol biopolymer transport system component